MKATGIHAPVGPMVIGRCSPVVNGVAHEMNTLAAPHAKQATYGG